MFTFTIGADVEFVLCKDGELVSASDYLISNSDFGVSDYYYDVAELRPHYSFNALQLVATIQKLLQDGCEKMKLKQFQFLAGHYKFGYPIGGHIHLTGYCNCRDYMLVRGLDIVLGTLSDCIDPLEERKMRRKEEKGRPSWLHREGNFGGIEYRQPGSWMLTPWVAFLNLWLAEATAYACADQKNFDELLKRGGCEGIITFAANVKNVKHRDLFLKVAEGVFNALPLDWSADFKEAWEEVRL